MNIVDCFMYFDEDMLLDIRLNTLSKYVYKFIVCEAKFNHNGLEKKLNFNINNFSQYKDKIIYIVAENQPQNLKKIHIDDTQNVKNSKILDNALIRENFQRNYCLKYLRNFSEEDLVLINDLDEIPNLKKFKFKSKITIFKQKMYYYKLNLEYPDFEWMGSRICKIKDLENPQWLRNVKPKKYSRWRLDTLFSKKKFNDISFVESGGWHFTNIKSPEKIDHKMKNFLHHLEYEHSGMSLLDIKNMIKNKKVMYDHGADKKNMNKWRVSKSLKKVDLDVMPEYVKKNYDKFKIWID